MGRLFRDPSRLVLVLILAGAFALRYRGVWFGHPLPLHPDEPQIVQSALRIWLTGDWNPHYFSQPSLAVYLQTAVTGAVVGIERLVLGRSISEVPVIHFYVAGRVAVAALATGTLVVVHGIARRMAGASAGLAAASLLAVSPLHVASSVTLTVEAQAGLFVTLAIALALRILDLGCSTRAGASDHEPLPPVDERASLRRAYLLAGVCVGLAAGTKYTMVLAALPVLIAHAGVARSLRRLPDAHIGLAAAAAVVAFLVSTPYALLAPREFAAAIGFLAGEYGAALVGPSSVASATWGRYLGDLLGSGFGALALGFALLGFVQLVRPALRLSSSGERAARLRALVLLSLPAALWLVVGAFDLHFTRNLAPLLPALCVSAGIFVSELYHFCRAQSLLFAPIDWYRDARGRVTLLAAGSTVLIFCSAAVPAGRQAAFDVVQSSLPDTRWVSARWLDEHLPEGARILRESYTPPIESVSDRFDVSQARWDEMGRLLGASANVVRRYDYVVLSSASHDRFVRDPEAHPLEAAAYAALRKRARLVQRFEATAGVRTGPTIEILALDSPALGTGVAALDD